MENRGWYILISTTQQRQNQETEAEKTPSFEEFTEAYAGTVKARYGVTIEQQKNLFTVSSEYFLIHRIPTHLCPWKETARSSTQMLSDVVDWYPKDRCRKKQWNRRMVVNSSSV